ncbi:hypothetical protein CCR95_00220 [Thiocystis minor]|nr:hypothetical protein [Thiocystis minor]
MRSDFGSYIGAGAGAAGAGSYFEALLHAPSVSVRTITVVMVPKRALLEMLFICRYLSIEVVLEIHATEMTAAISMLDCQHL